MVVMERKEGRLHPRYLWPNVRSSDIWPHWNWGSVIMSVPQQHAPFLQPAPTVTFHMQQCWVHPLLSIGRAENGEPRDHPVTIFNTAVIDLSLSPSLLCPSCHKLYRNQDEALFQMCYGLSGLWRHRRASLWKVSGAEGTRILTQSSIISHKRDWSQLRSLETTHTAIGNTLNRLLH